MLLLEDVRFVAHCCQAAMHANDLLVNDTLSRHDWPVWLKEIACQLCYGFKTIENVIREYLAHLGACSHLLVAQQSKDSAQIVECISKGAHQQVCKQVAHTGMQLKTSQNLGKPNQIGLVQDGSEISNYPHDSEGLRLWRVTA